MRNLKSLNLFLHLCNMKKSFVFLMSLLISVCGYAQKKRSQTVNVKKLKGDTIIWQKDSMLTFADFHAKIPKGYAGCASTFILLTPIEQSGNIVFSVQAVFMKSKSAITKTSDYILKHEQLHFDICELYARKLRQMMAETDFTKVKNIQSEIQKMYNKVNNEFIKTEDKYDNDTNHGENPAKQKVWDDDIASQMKDLDKYSEINVDVTK